MDSHAPESPGRWHASAMPLFVGAALVPILWLGLNAGPHDFTKMAALGTFAGIQVIAPLIVLTLAGTLLVWTNNLDRSISLRGPLGVLGLYAIVGLVGGLISSPNRVVATYWGMSFLAVPAALLLSASAQDSTNHLRIISRISLACCLAIAVLLLGVAIWINDLPSLLAEGHLPRLFGNYENEPVQVLAINANGAARFFAIAATLALVRLVYQEGTWPRAAWTILLGTSIVVLVFTQSRTTFIALLASFMVILFLRIGWLKTTLSTAAVVAGILAFVGPGELIGYLTRGQTASDLFTLTGRTDVWREVGSTVASSPIWGFGFHADRLLLGAHTHNAWLHSLLQSGLIGFLAFLAVWVFGWRGSIKGGLFQRFSELPYSHRLLAVDATAILTFLTIRSFAESSGAFFGVDLFVLAPLAAFLHALGEDYGNKPSSGGPGALREAQARPARVLVGAYACSPPGSPTFSGGEDLLGWKLTRAISRREETWVIISAEQTESIQAELNRGPEPSVNPIFVSLPRSLSWMRDHQGTIQLYAYAWQLKAAGVAIQLHGNIRFDLYHHITYANDWMASHAGALLEVPYIRGPGGGAQQVPDSFRGRYGLQFRLAQRWRSGLQGVFRADPFFRRGQERAERLLVCTPESREAMPERWREKTELFPVNGIDRAAVTESRTSNQGHPFTVILVGKHLKIKGFDLAIEAFARFQEDVPGSRLVIVGTGPETERLEALADELAVSDVEFTGWLPHDEALERIQTSDVLLFPSLRDGGGGVVVEAMALGTVVVCLDLAGPGLHTAHGHGVAVPARNPEQAIQDLATGLTELHDDPQWREILEDRARQRVLEAYTWEGHGERLQALYREILGHSSEEEVEDLDSIKDLETPVIEPTEEPAS